MPLLVVHVPQVILQISQGHYRVHYALLAHFRRGTAARAVQTARQALTPQEVPLGALIAKRVSYRLNRWGHSIVSRVKLALFPITRVWSVKFAPLVLIPSPQLLPAKSVSQARMPTRRLQRPATSASEVPTQV